MRKLFGNGRAVAGAILAVGVAAIAMPAFGESSGGGGGDVQRAGRPALKGMPPPPPPPARSGALRKRVDKTAECMRNQDIPGVQKQRHGMLVPPSAADSKAFRKAAKECGAPPPPPQGAAPHGGVLPPPPFGDPKARGKFDRAFGACLHAQRKH